ncbi:MAG: DUF1540 domain-containing protein [Clostridiales bacterium]|nr:DUF1540 domain-containing protein [Clostridiales bacterium]
MNNCTANECIRCTVDQCKYHCDQQNYCSLSSVKIGTHESNPTVVQCVDCESFVAKTGSGNSTSSYN